MALAEKVRLEIGVSNHFVQPTVDAILSAARTGEVGDGKIMVLPIEKIYRIRTGEEDQDAVTPCTARESSARQRHGSTGRSVTEYRRIERKQLHRQTADHARTCARLRAPAARYARLVTDR